jgi:hypothetical protein
MKSPRITACLAVAGLLVALGLVSTLRQSDRPTQDPNTQHRHQQQLNDDQPATGTVEHSLSGKRYHSLWQDGQLLHREELVAGNGRPVLLAEHEIQFVVGSGAHFTMYLSKIDGFLVESPTTWYSAKPGWDMSPGYDDKFQLGFQREITADCLFCHAGRADAVCHQCHLQSQA